MGESPIRVVWRRLLKNRPFRLGLALLIMLVLAALLADVLAPYSYKHQSLSQRFLPPFTGNHYLGTDNLGRDLFSRLLYGARISLAVGLLSVSISLFVGGLLGALAGYAGGWTDSVISRLFDLMLAFPSILLAIAIVSVLGEGLGNVMLAVGVVGVPIFGRQARASVLTTRELDYVAAARSLGAGPVRILFVHVLPNCLNPLLVLAALGVGTAVLDTAGLSFLGLGAKAPFPEWGTILADTYQYYKRAPWMVAFPGLSIMAMVLGCNLLGDGLRDVLDPRLAERG